jgi:hypothetical protein
MNDTRAWLARISMSGSDDDGEKVNEEKPA